MASRTERDRALSSRQNWQGGGELNMGQLDPSERTERTMRDDRYAERHDEEHHHRHRWLDRVLGRGRRREDAREREVCEVSDEPPRRIYAPYEDEREHRRVHRDDYRGGFGSRGAFSQLRDQRGRYIDEAQDQRRNRYVAPRDDESRSPWRGGRYRGDVYRYTSDDDLDREVRGIRRDHHEARSRQWASDLDEEGDDMRGQFRRSRDDGELGRRGVYPYDADDRRFYRREELRYFGDEPQRDDQRAAGREARDARHWEDDRRWRDDHRFIAREELRYFDRDDSRWRDQARDVPYEEQRRRDERRFAGRADQGWRDAPYPSHADERRWHDEQRWREQQRTAAPPRHWTDDEHRGEDDRDVRHHVHDDHQIGRRRRR